VCKVFLNFFLLEKEMRKHLKLEDPIKNGARESSLYLKLLKL
jgi:hypothetical protein